MLLLIGPAVALIGIVAVVFVIRHKAVEKRSMYSSRRSQIEHKVRAARQRTLGPAKRAEKTSVAEAPPAAQTYEAPAYAGPPVALPAARPAQPAWDTGPTAPAPSPPPPVVPQAPAYEPPAYEPAPPQAPAAQPEWTPTPAAAEPAQPAQAPAASATSAGGASWSVVGESKGIAEAPPEPAKKKKSKDDAQSGAWTLASGEVAGDDADDGPRKPSAALAIAQYAVLVVGLVMVLIGVVVMVANSHGT